MGLMAKEELRTFGEAIVAAAAATVAESCVCAYVCACACARVCVCVCACMRACVCVWCQDLYMFTDLE